MKREPDEYTAADKRAFYEPVPADELESCQNCGGATEELAYLEGWGFRACPNCAREGQLTDEAERLCPLLYDELIRANGLREIQAAFKSHPDSDCEHCRAERKRVQTDRNLTEATQSAPAPGEVA